MADILQKVLQEYGNKDKCKIRDPTKVEAILQKLASDGPSKLQVITDFDFTLSRFHKDGKRCDSCHGILDHSPLMPDSFREKAKALYEKYYHIELDHKMTVEEKIPHMITWYKGSHNLLIEAQVTKQKIQEMVLTSRALLRDSAVNVLSYLNDHHVPVLIFSAGVGNILEEILHREKAFFPNVEVISNYMLFNEDGECTSFREPLIHMFNKNETALDNPDYFQDLKNRHNALVLGDSIGDLDMGSGIHNPGALLRIGFLNDKIDERMDSLYNNFDVVLVDDQTFDFVNVVSRMVCAQPVSK
ncbi:unnamed protein product [Orchesella dallaii]|uniref:5'-nucleotidase n=1 Tax=Orchesella dallaii TaxID=48710 RepID=A0ABP1QJL3_9HEXA